MTPGARVAAAIEVLDAVLAGQPAEKVLTGWGRRHRFAGAGDRAAIRNHVFDALRCRRSFAWLGGAETGRGLMIGALRAAGTDPAQIFTGAGHAPSPLAPGEGAGAPLAQAPEGVRLDLPDWLLPPLRASLGTGLEPVAQAFRTRAPLFLRVHAGRTTRAAAQAALAAEGIAARPHPLSPWALEVTGNPRRVHGSAPYRDGLVEVQDAASQAVCAELPVAAGTRVLDYCAGGGGKALALAARGAEVTAHDADPRRMRDLPERARRAGAAVTIADTPPPGPFALVLCDVPCTGSGTWRRAPEAKWRLTPARLQELLALQAQILDLAAPRVAAGGWLAYVTCSLLEDENAAQAAAFLQRHPDWRMPQARPLSPLEGGDGFYVALLHAPTRGVATA